jgi:uncharacterized Zn finger protein
VSRWRSFDLYTRGPKQPPPEHGIRIKKAGTTWWGQRWIEALESVLRGDSGRLARGRTYARAGRTHDLVVKDGTVTAKVTGSRTTPYEVRIELAGLGDAVWRKAIDGMAQKAQFSAELLAGRMPEQIDEVFLEAGVSLFPKKRSELDTSCSCPDSGDPCKHVAATHYVLGEALDRDPFLLFELRGRAKGRVLDALRAARAGAGKPDPEQRRPAPLSDQSEAPEIPSVKLGRVKKGDYDKPREALPALHFMFERPATHGAVLRQLGAPSAWQDAATPVDVLSPIVQAAAEVARRIAMAESDAAGETPGPAQALPRSARKTATKRGKMR